MGAFYGKTTGTYLVLHREARMYLLFVLSYLFSKLFWEPSKLIVTLIVTSHLEQNVGRGGR